MSTRHPFLTSPSHRYLSHTHEYMRQSLRWHWQYVARVIVCELWQGRYNKIDMVGLVPESTGSSSDRCHSSLLVRD